MAGVTSAERNTMKNIEDLLGKNKCKGNRILILSLSVNYHYGSFTGPIVPIVEEPWKITIRLLPLALDSFSSLVDSYFVVC